MTPAPYTWLFETVILDTISVVRQVLTNIPDEMGNPFTIPMRSIYSLKDVTIPAVLVSVEPGAFQFGTGESMFQINPDDPHDVQRGAYARGSRVIFDVMATSDPQRRYIVDALLSGILTSYSHYPDGTLIQFAIPKALNAIGVTPTGFDRTLFPEADLQADRQEGQAYVAVVAMNADIWVVWSTPSFTPTEIDVTSQAEVGGNDGAVNPLSDRFNPGPVETLTIGS